MGKVTRLQRCADPQLGRPPHRYQRAAESKTYCDEIKGQTNGLAITELASHLQGQLVATHPAYSELFDAFAAPEVRGDIKARTKWAVQQMK